MKSTTLSLLLLICSMATVGQQNRKLDSKGAGPQAMCAAAAPKLRESKTTDVVLIMIVDTRGRVQSFKTESPKGLRLEKMKAAAAAIKAMQFEPAKLKGQPVMVEMRVDVDCSEAATAAVSSF